MAQGVAGSLRPRIFVTFWHYNGGRPLPQEKSLVLTFRGSVDLKAHGSVGVPRKKFPVTPPGIDPGTVRLVAQRLNHYATPKPIYIYMRRGQSIVVHFLKKRNACKKRKIEFNRDKSMWQLSIVCTIHIMKQEGGSFTKHSYMCKVLHYI